MPLSVFRLSLCLGLALLPVAGCRGAESVGLSEASITDLPPGWNQIAGDETTTCALGTPFSFFAWPGDPQRLMIYLQGGGACWNGENCDLLNSPTYDPIINGADHPSNGDGVLAMLNPANPVLDYSVVAVPYCTADLHLGSESVTYQSSASNLPSRTFTINHWGARNVSYVLDWTYRHVRDPEVVFVAGSSAGAIGASFWASQIAAHWPNARVVHLGDAAGGYRVAGVGPLLQPAGALDVLRSDDAFATIDAATFGFEEIYVLAAQARPNLMMAQFNFSEDATQLAFLRELGHPATQLTPLLAANLAEIRAGDPEFRSYTAAGDTHTILLRPAFYTLAVSGVAIRDWVNELLLGRTVEDVGRPASP